jgi:integrase
MASGISSKPLGGTLARLCKSDRIWGWPRVVGLVRPRETWVSAGTWAKPTVLRPNNFRRRVWRPALKAAGLPAYPPKVLRSSHATLLAQLATHPVAIQGRLRHSDPRIAQEYYTQFNAPMDAQVSQALEKAYRDFMQRRGLDAASEQEG